MLIEDDDAQRIAEEIRRTLGDDELKEQAQAPIIAREILGLKEQRTLSQIIRDLPIKDLNSFNFTLATLALLTAKHDIAVYLHKKRSAFMGQEPAQNLADVNFEDLQFQIAIYANGLAEYADIPENTFDAITQRIKEQQNNYLAEASLTLVDLQLFRISFLLTSMELANPDDHQIYPGGVEKIRHNYKMQRTVTPEGRLLQTLAFPNELRKAVNLPPLT